MNSKNRATIAVVGATGAQGGSCAGAVQKRSAHDRLECRHCRRTPANSNAISSASSETRVTRIAHARCISGYNVCDLARQKCG